MDFFFENFLKGDGALGSQVPQLPEWVGEPDQALGDFHEEAHLVWQKMYIGNPQSLVGKATAVAGHSRHIMALAASRYPESGFQTQTAFYGNCHVKQEINQSVGVLVP